MKITLKGMLIQPTEASRILRELVSAARMACDWMGNVPRPASFEDTPEDKEYIDTRDRLQGALDEIDKEFDVDQREDVGSCDATVDDGGSIPGTRPT